MGVFTPNQENMAVLKKTIPEVFYFLEHLGAQLDNLRGIASLCVSYLSIHRTKENGNHDKDKSCQGTM